MPKVKAIIDFSGYIATDLGPAAETIHTKMTGNADVFPAPPVSMTALGAQLTDFKAKLVARASRATADTIAFNQSRDALEAMLGPLGAYVNTVAKGDAAIVEKSGFPSYETTRARLPTPAAPSDLRLRHGDASGTIVARWRPDRDKAMNEVQKCFGDPNDEANWASAGYFSGGKAILGGIPPGALVWIRVRTIGTKGAMGAWSDPAQIRAL